MSTLTDLISNFGDIIELDFPTWNCDNAQYILNLHPGWVQYNPRKKNNRKGLSVTSLDGGYSGIPDLDSLREYNNENGTNYSEIDFKGRTSIVNQIPEISILLDAFPDYGRCHFLKLDAGGFFPPHRDNGTNNAVPLTLRLIVPICNFDQYNLCWVHEDKILNFSHGKCYFINTTKIHYLFSFTDMSCCFVMNVIASKQTINTILSHIRIK